MAAGRSIGAVAALDALELVARETAGAIPMLFDSGIRSGADVFKAIALGADAVLDRPAPTSTAWLWPASPESAPSCATCWPNSTSHMGLSGCRTIADIREATLAG